MVLNHIVVAFVLNVEGRNSSLLLELYVIFLLEFLAFYELNIFLNAQTNNMGRVQ